MDSCPKCGYREVEYVPQEYPKWVAGEIVQDAASEQKRLADLGVAQPADEAEPLQSEKPRKGKKKESPAE